MGQVPFTTDQISSILTLSGKVKIGQYTGTGTYNSANPSRIECGFAPRFILIKRAGYNATYYCITAINPQKSVICNHSYNGTFTATLTWDETGVSWYSNSATYQLNANNTIYDYLIVG